MPLRRVSLCVFVFAGALLAHAVDTQTIPLNDEAMARQLEGKKTYEYLVHIGGKIGTPDGGTVTVAELSAYLKRAKPDASAVFVFWLEDRIAMPTAKDAIARFQKYGARVFAVRANKRIGPAGEMTSVADDGKKTAVFTGLDNPQAKSAKDKTPDVSRRPAALQPGKLKGPLRYKFVRDEEMIRGAEIVAQALLSTAPIEADSCATLLLVHPGAWNRMLDITDLASAKPMKANVGLKGRTIVLEGRFLETAEHKKLAVETLRKLITDNGGGDVRALTTNEMLAWWPFIAFDIEEPVYVVETKRHAHRFIVGLSANRLIVVDDLNGLPPL